MVLMRLKSQTLINRFKHINTNQPVHTEALNDVIGQFEGNINTEDPTGIKLYRQATKEIDKGTDKLDI